MGRSVVNISESNRLTQTDFSELSTQITLGPDIRTSTVDGETIIPPQSSQVTANQWVAMTQADQGLLDAIYNFINTTKDGNSIVPDNTNGRTKKLFFNFYGTLGKSIMPGEIGQFDVNFSYPPRSVSRIDPSTRVDRVDRNEGFQSSISLNG